MSVHLQRALAGLHTRHEGELPRPPRALQPRSAQLAYTRRLKGLIEQVNYLLATELLDELPRLVAEARSERGERLDAASDDVGAITGRVRKEAAKLIAESRVNGMAASAFRAVDTHARAQLLKQGKAVLGVDLFTADKWLTPASKAFIKENAGLITTLTNKQISETEQILLRGTRVGLRHEVIREQLMERFDIGERHAALIARDQVGKALGDINRLRMQSLGLSRYRWRTVGDDAVRDEHAAREGEIYSFDDPPEDGNPGEPINCRCTAEPVFEDLFEVE